MDHRPTEQIVEPASPAPGRRLSPGGTGTGLVLGAWIIMLLVPAAWCAGGSARDGAMVSGVVRDAQGVVQMGALVQVLAANSHTVGMAFTDLHGRYAIANLTPGSYIVRASQTLFVPTTRNNLQLRTGASAIVNLTLAALFETTSWLPAERRRANDPDDDWKWTLRSTINRPILRMVEDGEVIQVSSSATESGHKATTQVKATVASGDGGFGRGGLHNIVALHRTLDDGADMMLRLDVGSTRVPAAYGPSQEIEAGYERQVGFGGAARTVISYKAHPELEAAPGTGGFTVLEVLSAQRMNLADLLEVEVGGSLEAVRSGADAVAAHPFVRLTAHPGGGWTLNYRLATDRQTQSFDDVTTGRTEVPVALVANRHLQLEQGRHQEASVARRAGRGSVELVYFRDALGNTLLSGGGASGPAETDPRTLTRGMLVDPTTGSFRTLGIGYTTDGARLTASVPLTDALWVAAEYSLGAGLASSTGGDAGFAVSLAGLKAKRSQAATVAVKGKLVKTQTQLRTSYRWQESQLVTAIDPFSSFSDQAFLSCMMRQPIRWGARVPQGLAATIDVTNLLAEGYRPFVSEDGRTLYFAQAPRTIQAGLSFTF